MDGRGATVNDKAGSHRQVISFIAVVAVWDLAGDLGVGKCGDE